jgi:hypothetical protein
MVFDRIMACFKLNLDESNIRTDDDGMVRADVGKKVLSTWHSVVEPAGPTKTGSSNDVHRCIAFDKQIMEKF